MIDTKRFAYFKNISHGTQHGRKIPVREKRLILKNRRETDPVPAEVIRIIAQTEKPRKNKTAF